MAIQNDELVKNTFYITYAFLMTTATITFIEAIRTKDMKIRNILNLETCISVVAGFFYTKFVEEKINFLGCLELFYFLLFFDGTLILFYCIFLF